MLAWADIGADMTETNVNGGAIALGHPLGATGAADDDPGQRTAAPRTVRGESICEGGGIANATIIERLD